MKMLHIVDGPPLYTNCFLLIGDEGNAVAIDPAADADRFVEALEENKARLTHILLTHGHHDHIGSMEPLRERYGARVYANAADDSQFGLNADEHYTDGGGLTVDDMTFTTLFTPGHTPGSTCIRCGDLLFTGDTLFAGDIGRTDLAGSSSADMRRSLRRLKEAVQGDPQVLPGHEEFSTFKQELATNHYLRNS